MVIVISNRRFRFRLVRGSTLRICYYTGLGSLLAMLIACSELTRVSSPDLVQPSDIANASGAEAQRVGAVHLFANALSQQAFMSGIITDELTDRSGTISSDERRVPRVQEFYDFPYDGLAGARLNALSAAAHLQQYSPLPGWHVGEMFAYAGYVETLYAEGMCSPLPLGMVVSGTPSQTNTVTRSGLIQDALANFDSALSHSADNDSIQHLAQIGRARVLSDSGDWRAAIASILSITAPYSYAPAYDGTTAFNVLFQNINVNLTASVSDREGRNGLDFISAHDPRVMAVNIGLPAAGVQDSIYSLATYTSLAVPIVLASSIEASLLRAEALLPANGGTGSAWLDTLNALRTSGTTTVSGSDTVYQAGSGGVTGLSPMSDPGSDASRLDMLFRERAFWLFGTGHRQGDLRRLVRQYQRAVEAVFPTGPYNGGPSTYGSDVAFLPFGEQGNRTYAGCSNFAP
jgi:hypothetical protein